MSFTSTCDPDTRKIPSCCSPRKTGKSDQGDKKANSVSLSQCVFKHPVSLLQARGESLYKDGGKVTGMNMRHWPKESTESET